MDAKEFFSRLEKISKGELRFRNPINEYGKLQTRNVYHKTGRFQGKSLYRKSC